MLGLEFFGIAFAILVVLDIVSPAKDLDKNKDVVAEQQQQEKTK